jgi:hypothetical protein
MEKMNVKSNNGMNVEFVNMTPHTINLNNGREFPSQGVARVSATFSDFDENGICRQQFGDVSGLPEPKDGVRYIVSALVLAAVKAAGRTDCVAPATGHPDCKRSEDKKIILSVPGFVE